MHRGSNNSKGGYDDKIVMVTAKPTRDGLNLGPIQDITQAVINSIHKPPAMPVRI